jgi:hypothetical protein
VSAKILSMPTDQILALLIAERDKLNRAIEALGAPTGKRRGRPPGSKSGQAAVTEPSVPAKTARKKRNFSPEQRAAAAKRMKAFWKKRRAAVKKG